MKINLKYSIYRDFLSVLTTAFPRRGVTRQTLSGVNSLVRRNSCSASTIGFTLLLSSSKQVKQ